MPSTREVRRRIRSVKNMAQITKAMQMVASSKMRRAQERVQEARPYADQIRALVSRLANATGEDIGEGVELLKKRPVRTIGVIVVTPDRGLCGALPSNINRRAALTAREESDELAQQGQHPGVDFVAVGRKGRDFIVRTQQNMIAEFVNYGDRPSLADARAIAQVAVDRSKKARLMLSTWSTPSLSTPSRKSQSPCNCCRYSPLKAARKTNKRALITFTNPMPIASLRLCCRATWM